MVGLAIEAAKMAVQFVGALIVARFAVTWALSRYKSEKLWERRLSAYADVVAALSHLKKLNEDWFDEAICRVEASASVAGHRRAKYAEARKKVEEVAAVGILLLPPASQLVLEELIAKLDTGIYTSVEEEHDHQGGVISKALEHIVDEGRRVLGVPCSKWGS